MDSKKIYLVTVGEYSDYRVMGAFSTKDNAEEFIDSIKAYSYEDPRIEECLLDVLIPSDKDAYYVELKCGEVTLCNNLGKTPDHIEELSSPEFWMHSKRRQEDVMCGYLWAKSREHAVKIASEKWFQMEANK